MKKKLSMILVLVLCAALVFALSAIAMADDEVVEIGGKFDIYSKCYGYGEEVYAVVIDANKSIEASTAAPEDFLVQFTSTNWCGNLQTTTRKVNDVTVVGNTITLNLVMTGNGTNTAIDMETFSVTLVGEITDTLGTVYNGSNFVPGKQINPELDAMIEGGTEYENYRLYIPEKTDKAAPLYIWLHGAGEFGDNNRTQVSCSNLLDWTQPPVQAIFDDSLYVLAIQSKTSPHVPENVMEVILEVVNEYNIDVNRIYIAGCSMGGMGTNDMIRTYPDFFAAAMPNCPASVISPEDAAKLVDLPIIYVHAANDTTVALSNSIQSYNNIKAAGSDNIWCNFFSVNPNNPFTGQGYMGHWSWTWIHDNYTTTEEQFINGEGVYVNGETEYPYVSTPLSQIGKGYANIAEWLADQEKTVTLEGDFDYYSKCYNYGEEVYAVVLKVSEPVDPDTVEPSDFNVYMGRNRGVSSVEVDGDTITINLVMRGSATNTAIAPSNARVTLVGDIKAAEGLKVFNASAFTAGKQINEELDAMLEGETANVKYRLFVPENTENAPLYVWLHGAGEFGNNNRTQVSCADLVKWTRPDVQAIFDDSLFVMAIQSNRSPHNTEWLMEAILQVCEEYDIDMSRIYIAGCSMGGRGTNDMIRTYPNFFAAAVPDCPASVLTAADAKKLTGMPIIYLHAANDTTVRLSYSIQSYNALKAAGSKNVWCNFFTTPPNNDITGRALMGHFSWAWIHDNYTTTEPEFINGEGVYTYNNVEYPYVSTPLSEIDGGYATIAHWFAGQRNVGIKVDTVTVDAIANDTVEVPVIYDGDLDLTTVRVTLDCELPIVDIITDNDYEFNEGSNEVIVYSGDKIDNNLFKIVVDVDGAADGTYPIYIVLDEATDLTAGPVNVRANSGAVIVDNVYPLGDVSQDGEVTNADLILLARYLVHIVEFNEKQMIAADINGDGNVTNTDLVLLARMVVSQ